MTSKLHSKPHGPPHLQPRDVSARTRERCEALLTRRAYLPYDQRQLLERIVAAQRNMTPVFKHELDRALGIVGSWERTV